MDLRLRDISDRDFDVMHAGVLRLLEEVGVLFEDQRARDLLGRAGNALGDDGRIRFKPGFVEETIEQIPADGFVMYGRDESKSLHVACDRMSFRPSTGAPFILDYETRRRRDATMADARTMALLTDAFEHFGMVNSVVSPPDAPGGVPNLHRFVNAHRHSLKPSDITVMNRSEVEGIAKVSAAIRGSERTLREKPLTAVDVAMISPLRCTAEQSDAFCECAKWGLPIEVLTSPMMGMTGPVTISGSTALGLAEVLAAVCLIYQVAPGLGIINTTRVSPSNMRTTAYNYGAPELSMASVLTAAVSARYNLPCNLYGLGAVADRPGAQAQLEKTLGGALMALGRPHMITGSGILANALVTSPEQLAIDHETARFLTRVRQPIEVTDEALGVDVLAAAVAESGRDVLLLAEDHTVEYLRKGELLDAGLGQWSPVPDDAPDRDLFDLAHEVVEKTLAEHTVEPFEAAMEKRIGEIISEAERCQSQRET